MRDLARLRLLLHDGRLGATRRGGARFTRRSRPARCSRLDHVAVESQLLAGHALGRAALRPLVRPFRARNELSSAGGIGHGDHRALLVARAGAVGAGLQNE